MHKLIDQMEDRRSATESPIRVGFVMHVMQVAGAEVLVKQIIERLGQEIEATVFCLDDLGTLGQQLRDAGVPVIVFGRKPGVDWTVAKRLAEEIRNHKIEVLHAHQYTPYFYSALSRLLHRAPCKIIFTEHGRHYPDVVGWKRHWINRLILSRFADASTACCDFSAEAVREIEGFKSTFTLPNGVDLSELPSRGDQHEQTKLRENLKLREDLLYAACVARFHSVKDHPTLIRAWKCVAERLPSARLLLIGDGEERSSCERLAHELGVSETIEFWGVRRDVASILRAVDVFALSSISEAASLTLLEAMASECPVVLTDVGGNAEHAIDGEHGRLVPRGDSQAMGQALVELLSDPERSRKMGQSARQRVIKQFDLVKTIEAYREQYFALAGRQTNVPKRTPSQASQQAVHQLASTSD